MQEHGFFEEMPDCLVCILDAAFIAAAYPHGTADFVYVQGFFLGVLGEIGVRASGKVVGVKLYFKAVKRGVDS
jgi:hypothetical protein